MKIKNGIILLISVIVLTIITVENVASYEVNDEFYLVVDNRTNKDLIMYHQFHNDNKNHTYYIQVFSESERGFKVPNNDNFTYWFFIKNSGVNTTKFDTEWNVHQRYYSIIITRDTLKNSIIDVIDNIMDFVAYVGLGMLIGMILIYFLKKYEKIKKSIIKSRIWLILSRDEGNNTFTEVKTLKDISRNELKDIKHNVSNYSSTLTPSEKMALINTIDIILQSRMNESIEEREN